MSEPKVISGYPTAEPVAPDPQTEKDRKLQAVLNWIEELEYDALVLQGRIKQAETMRHQLAAKLTKARTELAKLLG